jgi:hypothetical protein
LARLSASAMLGVQALPSARSQGMPERAVLPAGSRLELRLTTGVSTRTSRQGDLVSAVLIADVQAGDGVVPSGSMLQGVVRQSTAFSWSAPQAVLWLDFNQLLSSGGQARPIATKVVAVDNARETIDHDGRILGISPPREAPARDEDAIALAARVIEVFERAEFRVRELERPEITYGAGVELAVDTVTPTPDLPVRAPAALSPPDQGVLKLVDGQPFRTTAGKPPRAADVINFLFVGTEQQLADAFLSAGWNTAAALGLRADVKTALAVAEDRGYKLGPVSMQSLDGRPPDQVFQKQNDTFDKRHHIRIWKLLQLYRGHPIWLGGATRDVGVKFVRDERTFTHRVGPDLDLERQKVMVDLLFTGRVAQHAFVGRPQVPPKMVNATEDPMTTDGKIAVVVFRE